VIVRNATMRTLSDMPTAALRGRARERHPLIYSRSAVEPLSPVVRFACPETQLRPRPLGNQSLHQFASHTASLHVGPNEDHRDVSSIRNHFASATVGSERFGQRHCTPVVGPLRDHQQSVRVCELLDHSSHAVSRRLWASCRSSCVPNSTGRNHARFHVARLPA